MVKKFAHIEGKGDRVLGIKIIREEDPYGDPEKLEQLKRETDPQYLIEAMGVPAKKAEREAEKMRERVEAYDAGEWVYTGTYAVAEVVVNTVIQTIQSGGLWGTESDSAESYFTEIAKEEYNALVSILKKLGFKKIPPFRSAERDIVR